MDHRTVYYYYAGEQSFDSLERETLVCIFFRLCIIFFWSWSHH